MKALLALSFLKLFPLPAGEILTLDPNNSIPAAEINDKDDNDWNQQGVMVTNQPLDIAIQGQGFFWLIDGRDGSLKLTRYGAFAIDTHGNLVHKEHGDQVLKRIPGGVANISISEAETILDKKTGEKARLDTLEVTLEGHLIGHYRNGENRDIGTLAVLTFEHPRQLKRIGQDLFAATDAAGIASFDAKNYFYSGSLEGHDESIYDDMNLGK